MKNKYLILILFLVFLFSCGDYKTLEKAKTNIKLSIKNGPALSQQKEYIMKIQISNNEYQTTITENYFNITIEDVPLGLQLIAVSIYEGDTLIVKGYTQIFIVEGYNTCEIDFQAPTIIHTPATIVGNGSKVSIRCQIKDDLNQSNVSGVIYYSNNNETYYTTTMLKEVTTTYYGYIPKTFTSTIGETVYYYLKGSDKYHTIYYDASGNKSDSSNIIPLQVAVVPNYPPIIRHEKVTGETEYRTICIEATVIDTGGLDNVTLFFKNNVNATNYISYSMIQSVYDSSIFYEYIPYIYVRYPYVDYYICAYDDSFYTYYGNAGYSTSDQSSNSIRINIAKSPDTIPPVIVHIANLYYNDSRSITITATVTDDSGVAWVKIKYKKVNDTSFSSIQMTKSANIWEGTINFDPPYDSVVYYYFEASDGINIIYYGSLGLTTRNPELYENYLEIEYMSQDFSITFTKWQATGNAGSFNPTLSSFDDNEIISLSFFQGLFNKVLTFYFGYANDDPIDAPLPTGTYYLTTGQILCGVTYTYTIDYSQYYAWGAWDGLSGSSGSITITSSSTTYIAGTFSFSMVPLPPDPEEPDVPNYATGNLTIQGNFWMNIK